MKINSAVDNFIETPNRTEFCSKVRFIQGEKTSEGYVAIVLHDKSDKKPAEACLLFMKEPAVASTAPVVLKVLPIYSDLKVDTSQSETEVQENNDSAVKFTLKQDSANIIFLEKEDMSKMLNETKELIKLAEQHNYNSDTPFDWIDTFTSNKHRVPSRSNSLPLNRNLGETLRHVLPLQRAETIEKINLKRTRTIAKTKQRSFTLDAAKEHYLNAQLKKKEDQFVQWEKATVFVGTWNVCGSAPTVSFTDWLQGTLKTDDGELINDPDFYVIGLQEMETNKEAYIRYDPEKEMAWIKAILRSLKDEGRDYYKVESLQLVTMLLIVIAKQSHKPDISEVAKTYAGVGLMNMMGNKGGIAIRLRFRDSYLCFVTSHLAAFAEKTEKRNQDFGELTKRLLFSHRYSKRTSYISYSWNDGGDEGVTFLENNNVVRDWRRNASVFHNDFLIWCGDLNYRINLDESVTKHHLEQGNLELLLKYDQLSIERSAGRTFSMFDEGEITFSPTYKYDVGTNRYDTSVKRRTPSWTDRILWKKESTGSGSSRLNLLSYKDCKDMMMSDHKPVRALMNLDIRKIDDDLQKKTLLQITEHLEETKDEQPYGDLSSSFVEFGDVEFMEYKEKSLTLTNTGRVLSFFEFVPKVDDETSILPPWLQVTPMSGVIAPGEKAVIRFEITVDPTHSTALNLGGEKLDDILVLHLEDSRDFFVSVTGNYKPTFLGVSLEKLEEVSVPVIAATRQKFLGTTTLNKEGEQEQGQEEIDADGNSMLDLPKPLWKILNFLWNENMFKIESLFLNHGDYKVSSYIRKCLDDDTPFDSTILLGTNASEPSSPLNEKVDPETIAVTNDIINNNKNADNSDDVIADGDSDSESNKSDRDTDGASQSANSMLDVLITFLDCLPEPIISTQLYSRALEASESNTAMNYIKENLNVCHRNTLLYIGVFLRQAIDHAPASCKEQRQAAIIENFTVLLRPPIDFKEHNPVVAKQKREQFISQLLESLKI